MRRDTPDLLDWLGLRRKPDFSKARWLGGLISVLTVIALAVLLASAFIEFFSASWSEDPNAEALRNSGLVLAAMIGVPFLVWRSVVAQKQVDVAEQGHITDRINTAVQGLGAEKIVKRQRQRDSGKPAYVNVDGEPDFSQPIMEEVSQPNLEVRIGAIYALERIAQDSDRDHVQVMEILCAYVRQNAPSDLGEPFPTEWQTAFEAQWGKQNEERPLDSQVLNWSRNLRKPREDIQVALSVIGRRTPRQIALEGRRSPDGSWIGYRLDLRGTCLQNAYMQGGCFDRARFNHARLQGANLNQAQLRGTVFNWSEMQAADLVGAQLERAELRRAQLQESRFVQAQMRAVDLSGARMQGAIFNQAQMQGARISETVLQKAYFMETCMQGADLTGAQMQNAKFRNTQLRDATLRETQLQGSSLDDVDLQGANLAVSGLQGVELFDSQIDEGTLLLHANLRGAAFRFIDCTNTVLTQEQVDSVFADQTVKLSDDVSRPNWPEVEELDFHIFDNKWRAWQKLMSFDPDDPKSW